jgi:signal transduction histidine kinase
MGDLLTEIRERLERLAYGPGGPTGSPEPANFACMAARVRRGHRFAADLMASTGGQQLAPAVVEPLPLLCSLAQVLDHTLDSSIDVAVNVDSDCPPCHVDARALEEALLNLVVNARDAMPCGGSLHLAARAVRLSDGRPGVAVSVIDSGVGMTPDVARYATRPFFTSKSEDPLAGLGLSAVEGFVRQSGGVLDLHSAQGAGTTVTLYLMAGAPDRR